MVATAIGAAVVGVEESRRAAGHDEPGGGPEARACAAVYSVLAERVDTVGCRP